jgi:hypothetical protein
VPEVPVPVRLELADYTRRHWGYGKPFKLLLERQGRYSMRSEDPLVYLSSFFRSYWDGGGEPE